MRKGNSNTEGIIILAIILIVLIIMPKGTSNSNNKQPALSLGASDSNTTNLTKPTSSYSRSISLNTGNASYAFQSYEEYITITNRGNETINITNWFLKNGKDKRAYNLTDNLQYFQSDTATIGRATLYVSPTGSNTYQNVLLKPGEEAIVTTGSIGSQSPYKIVSFKENTCSGYLENLSEYDFTPSLRQNCPIPKNELDVSGLDTECRKFIERMQSCHTPEFETRNSDREICYNCVDGKPLSGSCVAFIKNTFNYGSCIANHSTDTNFSSKTWRIFLDRGWEMWAKDYETIELFDQFGRLVTSRTY